MHSRFETAVAASLVALVTGFSLHAVRTGIFAGQSIPIDSLYVNGTGGEELEDDYSIDLEKGSDFRIRWNMNTVSTREGYSIYCGLQKNGGGYALVEPEKDVTEDLAVSTTYDFECRSCQTGLMSSCFAGSNSDYITTYQRSIRVSVEEDEIVSPPTSGNSVPQKSASFVAKGTKGESLSGDNLGLEPGSQARFSWNVPTELREPYYSVYCGMKKNGGSIAQVPASNDSVEQITSQTTFEFMCRTCPNWKDYDGYVEAIVPWNNCWNPSNTNFTEIIRKKVVVDRIAYCGNSIREGRETCDDGNTVGGDGCSASCSVEVGYACNGTSCASNACNDGIDNDGDGLIDGQQNREAYTQLFGNEAQIRAYLNGISALITPEPLQENEFACEDIPGVSEADRKDSAADKFCKLFQYDEAVSVSCVNNSYDKLKGIWGVWHGEQMIREPSFYGNYPYYNTIRCAINPDCSDGVDNDFDGKTDTADSGCTNKLDTSEQAADNGCTGPEDPSEGGCGDGRKESSEQCDDGNATSGDGCSTECRKENVEAQSSRSSAISSASSASSRGESMTSVKSASSMRPFDPFFPMSAPAFRPDDLRPAARSAMSLSPFPMSAPAFRPEDLRPAARSSASLPMPPAERPPLAPPMIPSSASEQMSSSSSYEVQESSVSDAFSGDADEGEEEGDAESLSSTAEQEDETDFPAGMTGDSTATSGCPADACSFGRRCVEIPEAGIDCILQRSAADVQTDIEFDPNYLQLIRTNNESMRYRCMLLSAIWSADGFTCEETFTFPYVKRVPIQMPLGANILQWIGSLLSF